MDCELKLSSHDKRADIRMQFEAGSWSLVQIRISNEYGTEQCDHNKQGEMNHELVAGEQ